ncbi:MAG TPA: hypothetical protein ENJ12_13710, partial [Thiolapillus brandeum]|nr:hypothetical protein [Thiolapillus brandeum]
MNKAAYYLVLGIILGANASALATAGVKPFFSAPYTGKKVQNYDITLPLSRYEQETFTIPQDCSKLNSRLLDGNGHWGNRIERRLWIKAD